VLDKERRRIGDLLRTGPCPHPQVMRHLASDAILHVARRDITEKLGWRIPDADLHKIQMRLLLGRYSFAPPPRWVTLRRNGRRVALQTIPDMVVARALTIALEMIWKAHRYDLTFCWSQGRGLHQALKALRREIESAQAEGGQVWVIHADIHHAFQETPHDLVLEQLSHVVSDETALTLISSYLHSVHTTTGRGIGQGTHLAPTLADIAFDPVDRQLATQGFFANNQVHPHTRSTSKETPTHQAQEDAVTKEQEALVADYRAKQRDFFSRSLTTRRPYCVGSARGRSLNTSWASGYLGRGEEGATAIRCRYIRYGDNLLVIVTVAGTYGRSTLLENMYQQVWDFLQSLGLDSNEKKKHIGPVEERFDFLGLHCWVEDHRLRLALTDHIEEKLYENLDEALAERLRDTGASYVTYAMMNSTVDRVSKNMKHYYQAAGVEDLEPLRWAAEKYKSDWLDARMNESIA
jgi:hypothetical protein